MKRIILFFWFVFVVLLPSCSQSVAETPNVEVTVVMGIAQTQTSEVEKKAEIDASVHATLAVTQAPEVVEFTDPVLEAMLHEAMGKLEGDITLEDAEAVKKLDLGIEWQLEVSEDTQIKDISGLENFKNPESLGLHHHTITDIPPLAGLDNLTSLSLGGNPAADIAIIWLDKPDRADAVQLCGGGL